MAPVRSAMTAIAACGLSLACTTNFDPLFAGCPAGFADCNGAAADGCEVDLRSTREHCGACGNTCDGACLNGACSGTGGTGAGGGGGTGGTPPSGSVSWADRIGDAGIQRGRSIGADAAGDVTIGGYFFDGIVLEGASYPAAGEHDVFVQKRTSQGEVVWSRRFGGAGNDTVRQIAVSPDGEVVVTGHFGDTIDFGGPVLQSAGLQDLFLAKLDAAGDHVWSKSFGDATEPQFGQSVALDSTGRVHLGGQFAGSVDFGGGPLQSAGSSDGVIARFDASGQHDWSWSFGGTGYDYVRSLGVGAGGEIYVTGIYEGAIDLGGWPLAGDADPNMFVARLAPDGMVVWARGFGVGAAFSEAELAVVAGGGVVVAGGFAGTADFGDGFDLQSDGLEQDVYVVALTADGAVSRAVRFGDEAVDYAEGVAVGPGGETFVAVAFTGTIDFGTGPIQTIQDQDVAMARLSPDLSSAVWSRGFGGPDDQHPHALHVAPGGDLLAIGCIYGDPSSIGFGDVVLHGAGEFDVWFAALAP